MGEALARHWSTLEILVLGGQDLKWSARSFDRMPDRLVKLRELSLSSTLYLEHATLERIFECCANLERLHLIPDVSNSPAGQLTLQTSRESSLKYIKLEISRPGFTDTLSDIINGHLALEHLQIENCGYPLPFGNAAVQGAHLRHLSLRVTMTEAELSSLADGCPHLKYLDISFAVCSHALPAAAPRTGFLGCQEHAARRKRSHAN
jgi:hypothetical protein